MAPENVHLSYINKTLININILRYELFRNVSLKLSSLNKSSYEWSSKAIFNAFSPEKAHRDLQTQSKRGTKIALKMTERFIHATNNSKHIQ